MQSVIFCVKTKIEHQFMGAYSLTVVMQEEDTVQKRHYMVMSV